MDIGVKVKSTLFRSFLHGEFPVFIILSNPIFCFLFSGWVMLQGRQEEVDQSQILEYCVQRLQDTMKLM